MDKSALDRICRDVYRKYPEVDGVRPRQRSMENGGSVLLFETRVTTGDGRPMHRTIRVSLSADGRVLKMSASK